jgi:hypothetical protein
VSWELKYQQNDKEWEVHGIGPLSEVKYYKTVLSEKKNKKKRKGGDKACILLHVDRDRQSSTVPTPSTETETETQNTRSFL